MLSLTADDADRVIAVAPGDEITIALGENPTTGFQWTIEALPPALTLVASEFEGGDSSRPGAGGRRTIRLRAAGPGTANVRLRYSRKWEDAASARHYTFTFAIRSA
jgi:inhibitor of cysteine peptidase